MDWMDKCRQIALQHVVLLHTVLQIVAMAKGVKANIAVQVDAIRAVDCHTAPVGAAAVSATSHGERGGVGVSETRGTDATKYTVSR
jgi:hypothetical protein